MDKLEAFKNVMRRDLASIERGCVRDTYPYRLGALSMAARQYLKSDSEYDRRRLAELVNAEFPDEEKVK